MALDKEDVEEIAKAVARATVEAIAERGKRDNERLYGLKQIADECGVTEVSLKRWVARHGFPLDKDPKGYSVKRWNLERWFEERRRAVKGFAGY